MVSFKWGHRRNRILYKMNKYNKEGKRHGLYEWYHSNGKLRYKAKYVNGQPHGLCEWYYSNGDIEEIEYHLI